MFDQFIVKSAYNNTDQRFARIKKARPDRKKVKNGKNSTK